MLRLGIRHCAVSSHLIYCIGRCVFLSHRDVYTYTCTYMYMYIYIYIHMICACVYIYIYILIITFNKVYNAPVLWVAPVLASVSRNTGQTLYKQVTLSLSLSVYIYIYIYINTLYTLYIYITPAKHPNSYSSCWASAIYTDGIRLD